MSHDRTTYGLTPEEQAQIEKASKGKKIPFSRPTSEYEKQVNKKTQKQNEEKRQSSASKIPYLKVPTEETSSFNSFKNEMRSKSRSSTNTLKLNSSCFTIFNVLTGIDALSDHSESRSLSQCFTDLMDTSPSKSLKERFNDLSDQSEETKKKSLKKCFTDLMDKSDSKSLEEQFDALSDKSEPKSLKQRFADLSDKTPLEKQFTDFINTPAENKKSLIARGNFGLPLHGAYPESKKRVVKEPESLEMSNMSHSPTSKK